MFGFSFHEGYSYYWIPLVLAVAVPLGALRPWWLFLGTTVAITGGSLTEFVQTRTPWLGAFMNLNDTCLYATLWALFYDWLRHRSKIQLPGPVVAMVGILLVASFQTSLRLGVTYDTIRALRWALSFPIAFFAAANFHWDEKRAWQLAGALFLGAFLAGVQHSILIIRIGPLAYHGFARTIEFLASGIPQAVMVVAMLLPLPRRLGLRFFYLFAMGFMLLSTMLSQTRSVWLAMIASIPMAFLCYRQPQRLGLILRLVVVGVVGLLIAVLVFQAAFPEMDLIEMTLDRFFLLMDKTASEGSTGTRMRAFEYEMSHWKEGTWILGRGLDFFQGERYFNEGAFSTRIAYGHLGYVTYLSQLGLLGLFIYAVYLPWRGLKTSIRLWNATSVESYRYLAALSGVVIFFLCVMFIMSSSLLGLAYHPAGLVLGAAWAIDRKIRLEPRLGAEIPETQTQEQA
jgi:hypothetical protein